MHGSGGHVFSTWVASSLLYCFLGATRSQGTRNFGGSSTIAYRPLSTISKGSRFSVLGQELYHVEGI